MEDRRIDFHPGREHKSAWFLRLDPLGQVPVVEDGDLTLCDAQAILTHLAARYDRSGRWYPTGDARTLGEIAHVERHPAPPRRPIQSAL